MFYFNQQPGRTVMIEGEAYLFFSGYAYLGMSYVPEFVQLVKEGIDKYGVLFPSSRVSNTRLPLYNAFEEKLAALTRMEACISFSSGYLSGQVAAAVLSHHPHLFISPQAHPAVIPPGMKPRFNTDDWENRLLDYVHTEKPAEIALITDSINTGTGAVHSFSFLEQIPDYVKVTCLVDDSHGIGLLGTNGEGILTQLPQRENIEYVISCSLSKAFHLEGGAICCSAAFAATVRKQATYAASTAIMPAFMHSFMQADDLYRKQRLKLMANISSLAEKLKDLSYVNHYGLPIFVLPGSLTEDEFKPFKIIISSFGYPNPGDPKNNRVVVSALHTAEDLTAVANSIRRLY